jgi:hypothetical protein
MFSTTSAHGSNSAASFHETVLTCDSNVPIYFDYGLTGSSNSTYNFEQPAIIDVNGTLTQVAANLTSTSPGVLTTIGPITPTESQWPANIKFYGWNEKAFPEMNSKIGDFVIAATNTLAGGKINVLPFSNLQSLSVYPFGNAGTLNITSITGYENRPMKGIVFKNLNITSNSSRLPPDGKLADVSKLTNYVVQKCTMTGTLPNNKTYTSLVTYDISGNNFTSPAGWTITSAPALTTFNVANNASLTSLPTFTSSPTALTTIYAHNDTVGAGNIASIPALTSLPKIQTITLGNNKLAGTVPTMNTLTTLQTFSAPQNLYTALPVGHWSGNKVIKNIDLSNNNLNKYVNSNEYWFSGCTNLDTINFSGNKLSGYLPRFDFSSGINSLDLSNNSFTLIGNNYFTGINVVNGIQTPTVDRGWSGLKVFNVSNNKLNNKALGWPMFRTAQTTPLLIGCCLLEQVYAANNELDAYNDPLVGFRTFGFGANYPMPINYIDISNNNFTVADRNQILGLFVSPTILQYRPQGGTLVCVNQTIGGIASPMVLDSTIRANAAAANWVLISN